MNKLYIIIISSFVTLNLSSQNYWQQKVIYEMNIDFNVKNHQFSGNQKLKYYNLSHDTLQNIFYHLYLNAFQPGSMMDKRSMSILDPDKRVQDRISKLSPNEIGFQKILNIFQNGTPLSYQVNGTILEVILNDPIYPNDSAIFDMNFLTQVPIQIRRTGRDNSEGIDYSMSQWYPKICEYDENGWNSNPYISREFHGVWGDFNVNIKIDADYTIAATGKLTNPEEIGHGYKNINTKKKPINLTWKFQANNVHDFVWAADRDYNHKIINNDNGPNFHLFYQKNDKTKEWENLEPYLIKTFEYANKNFGKYPYDHYSIIQGGDGGMEYPMATLITGNRNLRSLVGVCVHEIMHSWYQGLMATNEALYAWMDEGFTSYASNIIERILFNEDSLFQHKDSYDRYLKIAKSNYEESLITHADHFSTNLAYYSAAYWKGVVFIDQLNRIIGEESLNSSLKRYYNEWSFKHPNPINFKRILEKESELELDWYFEYFVNTIKKIDYGISQILNYQNNCKLVLEKGEMPFPLEFQIKLKNGKIFDYYIPISLMRGNKEVNKNVIILDDWNWTDKYYIVNLNSKITDIDEIVLHSDGRVADILTENNSIKLPEKWNWEKNNLLLKIKKTKNKNFQKFKKIKI